MLLVVSIILEFAIVLVVVILADTGIWTRTIMVGVAVMILGFVLSMVSLVAEAPSIMGAAASIAGLGLVVAGMYIAIKGLIGYITAKAAATKKDR